MRGFLALIALTVAVTGCGGGGSPNPPTTNASSSVVTVTSSSGAPLSALMVTLSTGLTGTMPVGTITSQTTNASGQTTFANLPAMGLLCVSAVQMVGTATLSTGKCAQPFPATITLSF